MSIKKMFQLQKKRCANGYLGPKKHPEQRQYYFVCKHDSVVFGKCPNLHVSKTSTLCNPIFTFKNIT